MGALRWVCRRCKWTSPKWVSRCDNCHEATMDGELATSMQIASTSTMPTVAMPTPDPVRALPPAIDVEVEIVPAHEAGSLLERVKATTPEPTPAPPPDNRPQPMSKVRRETHVRYAVELGDMDLVLGGGLVAQSVIALLAEPGTGKSTLVLQMLHGANMRALYATAEETVAQVADRAVRIDCVSDAVSIVRESCLEKVLAYASELKAQILVIDSLQKMYSESIESRARVTQSAKCANLLNDYAKSSGGPIVFEICQVSGDGGISGPKEIEHGVDVVLELERIGDIKSDRRRLSSPTKNRFGATTNVARYRMGAKGLVPIKDAVEPERTPNDDEPDPDEGGGPEIH